MPKSVVNSLVPRLALRYALGSSSSHLVSFLSRLSMAGLVLGVCLLLTVLSVMNGFEREMRERILALVPQVTVFPYNAGEGEERQQQVLADVRQRIERHSQVLAVTEFTEMTAMLLKRGEVEPVLLYGANPETEADVSVMSRYADMDLLSGAGLPVIIGKPLAERLGLAVGENVSIALSETSGSGRSTLKFKTLKVAQIVSTGTELDQRLMLMAIDKAMSLPAKAPQLGLKVKLRDLFMAPQVAWELNALQDEPVYVSDWTRQFGNLYEAIQLSSRLVLIMLLAVVGVAVFNVVATLVMVVNDKRGDIAILRSQGASPRQILALFVCYGSVIGAVGVFGGAVLGVLLSYSIGDVVAGLELLFGMQFLNSDVYPIDYLPSDVRWLDSVVVCVIAWLMSAIATLYPAWRASRLAPAQVLNWR